MSEIYVGFMIAKAPSIAWGKNNQNLKITK